MTHYIPIPPDFIFEDPRNATEHLLDENAPVQEIEMVDYVDGINRYMQGVSYPVKGFVFPQAVFAINIAKNAFMFLLSNPLILLRWKKNKERFERLAGYALENNRCYLKPEHMTPVCREICKLPFGKTAKIIGHIFEYDDAYRYRLQDIMNELDVYTLFTNPVGELLKLQDIAITRDPGLAKKYQMLTPFIWLVFIFKFSFLEAIKDINFNNLKPDENDKYWMSQRNDYLFFGRDYETNSAMYEEKPMSYIISSKDVI
jgi:hypothetical protein